jgi:hypothetical protein
MRVYIAQLLCPQRHAIMASSAEAETEHDAQQKAIQPLREQVEQLLATGQINPWCDICGASKGSWHYEVGRTRFRTLEEALPALSALERENLSARTLFGGHPGPGKTN